MVCNGLYMLIVTFIADIINKVAKAVPELPAYALLSDPCYKLPAA